jgi:5-methylcytosine-specific restriction endonuclease McrA
MQNIINNLTTELLHLKIENEMLKKDKNREQSLYDSKIDIYKEIINKMRDPYKCKNKDIDKKEFLFDIQEGECLYCYRNINIEHMTYEHLIPKSYKGTNHLYNLCLVCAKCNKIRQNNMGDVDFIEVLQERMNNRFWYYPELSSDLKNLS